MPSARNGSSSSSWTDSGGLYDESGQDVPETAGEAYYEEEFYDDDAGRPADNNGTDVSPSIATFACQPSHLQAWLSGCNYTEA